MLRRLRSIVMTLCVWAAAGPVPAAPQSPLQAPPQTPYGEPISIDDAKKVAAACVTTARESRWSMAIAIVDAAGYLVYFERMANTQLASVDLAVAKAKSAALFRRPTKVFQDALAAGGDGLRILGLTGAMPNGGGVPIVVDGRIVGAVGVSGGSAVQDEQVAAAGTGVLK
jgi:uncharacterized protein GlcG (DUF336 family)